jgi:RimJ/RimL family protein N-acetyltransferase
MRHIEVRTDAGGEHLDDAAQIWAEATAGRDGDPDVAPLELSRPIIEAVLTASPRSLLLVASDHAWTPVGFAVAEPLSGEEQAAELRYLGVRPWAWGGGVATELLVALDRELADRGFTRAQLYVYVDNVRSVDLYRRMGWEPQPDVRIHPRSGRHEQRYTRDLPDRDVI